MRVYLAGPINGCSDVQAKAWRDLAKTLLNARVLDPMERDYRGREDENVGAIVAGDLSDIGSCDVVLVNALRPSWGTAMEVVYAHRGGKVVVAYTKDPVSPWLRYHATTIVGSLETACGVINGLDRPAPCGKYHEHPDPRGKGFRCELAAGHLGSCGRRWW